MRLYGITVTDVDMSLPRQTVETKKANTSSPIVNFSGDSKISR